jgi:chondroitin-sulfate-ABC endolyase/exolyase
VSETQAGFVDRIGQVLEASLTTSGPRYTRDDLQEAYERFRIVDKDGAVKGLPLAGVPGWHPLEFYSANGVHDLETPEKISTLMLKLARAWHRTDDRKCREQYARWYGSLTRHLMDQGYVADSGNLWNWYEGRNLAQAIFLMRKVLREQGLLQAQAEYFDYNYGTSAIFAPSKLNPNMDTFHIDTRYRLYGALMQATSAQTVRALKAFSAFLSKEMLFEGRNGFKADGSAFHHEGFYFGYARYAVNSLSQVVKSLAGSPFAISPEAYQRLKTVLFNMRFYANLGDVPLPLHGRHPFHCGRVMPAAFLNLALAAPGGIDGELAEAYLRLAPDTREAAALLKQGWHAESAPDGHLTMNFACISAHRRDEWLALARGYGKYVWSGETYQSNNRFGRYLSYGSLSILGAGIPVSLEASGYVEDGFDWNRIDGTTVIHLPLEELRATSPTEIIRSEQHFVGGLSHFGRNGLFVMQLESPKQHSPGFVGRKSVFFLDEMLVCLGSNIRSEDPEHETQTTLFQRHLPSRDTPIQVDGNTFRTFPSQGNLAPDKTHWLLDPQGNGYLVPAGQSLAFSRKQQVSRDEQDRKDTQGDFAAAWLEHGRQPRNASYLYYVFPGIGTEKMRRRQADFQDRAPVRILKREQEAHAIQTDDGRVTGAVLFGAQTTPFLPVVQQVERACLLMLEKKGGHLLLSIADPDLNLREVGEHGYVSGERPLHVTLKGSWQLAANPGGAVSLVQSNNQETILRYPCHNGASFSIELVPAAGRQDY